MDPFLFQIQSAFDRNDLGPESYLKIQSYFGASWILGCLSFGFIVILKPRGCQVTKLYLCIFSLILASLCSFLANFVRGESGHIVFVFVYATISAGYFYTFKMYAFDLIRSRNFAKIWPIFANLGTFIILVVSKNIFSR